LANIATLLSFSINPPFFQTLKGTAVSLTLAQAAKPASMTEGIDELESAAIAASGDTRKEHPILAAKMEPTAILLMFTKYPFFCRVMISQST
jgi:hypothetical protein